MEYLKRKQQTNEIKAEDQELPYDRVIVLYDNAVNRLSARFRLAPAWVRSKIGVLSDQDAKLNTIETALDKQLVICRDAAGAAEQSVAGGLFNLKARVSEASRLSKT